MQNVQILGQLYNLFEFIVLAIQNVFRQIQSCSRKFDRGNVANSLLTRDTL